MINAQLTRGLSGEWNFGPDLTKRHSVSDLVTSFAEKWGVEGATWQPDNGDQPHESGYLLLDSEKSRTELEWHDKLSFEESITWTIDWYKADYLKDALNMTKSQIQRFLELNTKR